MAQRDHRPTAIARREADATAKEEQKRLLHIPSPPTPRKPGQVNAHRYTQPRFTPYLEAASGQEARAHSDYFLCPPGNGAITTTFPSQAGPPLGRSCPWGRN